VRWYDWVAIAAADGMSGLGGAKLAMTIFPPYGSIAGAILGGGVGSYTMWLEITGNSAPPPPSGGHNVPPINFKNQYEVVGTKHNELMSTLIKENLPSDPGILYDFIIHHDGFVDVFSDKMKLIEFTRKFTKSMLKNQMENASIIDLKNGQTIKDFILENYRLKRINKNQKLILDYYVDVVIRIKDVKQVSEYSIFCENFIMRSRLNSQEKKEILVFFTTFRYSINFWSNDKL